MSLDDVVRTAVNQSPSGGTDYPFVSESVLCGSFLDFYLAYEDPAGRFVLPFTATVAGTTITIRDANSVVVLAADFTQCEQRAWGTRIVYQWVVSPFVMRAVMASIVDGSGTLDSRTCDKLPPRLRSLRVGLITVSGNVKFQAGYNIAMNGVDAQNSVDGGRFKTMINVDAVPGAGFGRVDGCSDVVPQLRKINQVGPDCSGNFIVKVDPCFRVTLPLLITGDADTPRTAVFAADGLTSEEAQHALKLSSDCHPCCECSDYVRTYRGLKRQWSIWSGIASDAEAVRDTYEANRARWLASKDCRASNPSRLVLSPDASCKTFVGGSFCNFTSCCLVPVEIRFTLRRYKNGSLISWTSGGTNDARISGSQTSGDENYAPQVLSGGQVVRFILDYANAQDMSIAKMKFCTTSCTPDEALEVTMTVHVSQPPSNPVTGDTCDMSDFDVPVWLNDIWIAAGLSSTVPVRALTTQLAPLSPTPASFKCGC